MADRFVTILVTCTPPWVCFEYKLHKSHGHHPGMDALPKLDSLGFLATLRPTWRLKQSALHRQTRDTKLVGIKALNLPSSLIIEVQSRACLRKALLQQLGKNTLPNHSRSEFWVVILAPAHLLHTRHDMRCLQWKMDFKPVTEQRLKFPRRPQHDCRMSVAVNDLTTLVKKHVQFFD